MHELTRAVFGRYSRLSVGKGLEWVVGIVKVCRVLPMADLVLSGGRRA
jgi:hypothetical protein